MSILNEERIEYLRFQSCVLEALSELTAMHPDIDHHFWAAMSKSASASDFGNGLAEVTVSMKSGEVIAKLLSKLEAAGVKRSEYDQEAANPGNLEDNQ